MSITVLEGCACPVCGGKDVDPSEDFSFGGTGKTITTTPLTGDAGIDGLTSGLAWGASTITYRFTQSASDYGPSGSYGNGEVPGFRPITTTMWDAADFALSTAFGPAAAAGFSVAGFTALNVEYTNTSTNADIRFAQTTSPVGNTAWAYFPGTHAAAGDVWFRAEGPFDYTQPRAGNYAWITMIHEIGHALGLHHPHQGRGIMPTSLDFMENTVMSYRSFQGASVTTGYSNETFGFAQTWMMLDIAALQTIYGADFTPNEDEVVYSWRPDTGRTFVNGEVAIDPGANRIFATIWDGGGNVTYDLSAYSTGVQIDLSPGGFSLFSTVQLANLGAGNFASGNIYNALMYQGDTRSLVQTAIGGSGDDVIVGNRADNVLHGGPGNDVIHGGPGNDILYGGRGADKLYGGQGHDALYGGRGNDVLYGGQGNDVLYGGPGNDRLFGGPGSDRLFGGAGRDRLDGGPGNDVLTGGPDADTFVFKLGHDRARVTDFTPSEGDVLELDSRLWQGNRSAAQVVDDFARVSNIGRTVFDFDSDHRLILDDFTNLGVLADHIVIA